MFTDLKVGYNGEDPVKEIKDQTLENDEYAKYLDSITLSFMFNATDNEFSIELEIRTKNEIYEGIFTADQMDQYGLIKLFRDYMLKSKPNTVSINYLLKFFEPELLDLFDDF